MRYKDFEGNIEELIRIKLQEIEKRDNVKILHAVESGSRAWGFASPDSDYDVRFIYVRPLRHYLSLESKEDFINGDLDEVLDINGWDLCKVLQHIHKSNATIFEWSNSPVVYYTTNEWGEISKSFTEYFSIKASMYHYYGTANKNYREHLQKDMVKYKKYFYVLRPLLACKWIEQKKCPPPVLFKTLMDGVLEGEIRLLIERLIEEKVKLNESEKRPKIEVINSFIEEQLVIYKEKIASMEDDRNSDWSELNKVFYGILNVADK